MVGSNTDTTPPSDSGLPKLPGEFSTLPQAGALERARTDTANRIARIFKAMPDGEPISTANGIPENITMRQLSILWELKSVMRDPRNGNNELLSSVWYGRLQAALVEDRFTGFRIAQTSEGMLRVHADAKTEEEPDTVFFDADGTVLGGYVPC